MNVQRTRSGSTLTPAQAVARGFAAGFAASLTLSALARVLPGMTSPAFARVAKSDSPTRPRDPFDRQAVEQWQARSQSPAAYRAPSGKEAMSAPARALELPQAPGPEGLAEQFAFKVGAGLFDTDIATAAKPAGLLVHLAYGSLWGALYGIVRASSRPPRRLFGALYGLGVYLVGPGLLVPAMKLMGRPWEEPPVRTAMMIGGHAVYGLTVAEVFQSLGSRGKREG